MRKLFSAVAVLVLTAGSIWAKPVAFECDVDTSRSRGWITDKLFVEFDEAAGTARVLDGVIYHFESKTPKSASLTTKQNQNVISWRVLTKDSRNQVTQMQYRATFLKKSNEVIVSASPGQQFKGRYSGRGRCKQL